MDEGRWKELDELLEGALSVEPHERPDYLKRHCPDPDVRDRIERLIAAAEDDGPFATGGAFAHTPPEELPTLLADAPETIPGYELRRPIGAGGMGRVFEADQLEPVRRRVAVKIVLAGGDTSRVVARFESERQTLALMNHPGIAQVYDAGMTDSRHPFFSMELVDGPPITMFCDEQRLGLRERLELFVEVCDAVQHAHQKGVIHRDLKPSNVLVKRIDGRPAPKVIDFGIARLIERSAAQDTLLTEAGAVVGTPEYMSPEQAGAGAADVDTRSDVYSLGVLLYELLTGSLPFRRRDSTPAGLLELIQEVQRRDLPLPSRRLTSLGEQATEVAAARKTDLRDLRNSLRRDLDWIASRALEKDRERRYASVGKLADDVRRYLDHEPVEACPPDFVYRLRKFALRNRGLLAASAAVFLALVAGLAGTVAGLLRAREEAEHAREQAAVAEAINEFVNEDLLAAVSPGRQGREVGMREVLDTAAERLEGRFADQPEVEASVRATIGSTYFGLGELDQAVAHLERAIELYERTQGPDGPGTLETVHVLGEVCFYQSRGDEAEALLRRAFEGRDRTLGPDHELTLSALSDLGAVAHYRGNLDEAERCYRLAYERAGGELGEENEYTLAMIHNLGALLRDRGRFDEAEPFVRRSWEGSRRRLGDEHPETLASFSLLGSVMREDGRLEEAEPIYEEVYEARRRVLGEDHPSTLLSGNNLAMLYMDKGRLEEAAEVERTVLANQRRVLGDDHDDTVLSMSNLAAILMRLDRPEDAEPLLEEALERCVRTLGGDHSLCGSILRKRGRCFTALGRYEEAERSLLEANRVVAGTLGEEHPDAKAAATITAELYEAWGKPEEAATWRARAEAPRR